MSVVWGLPYMLIKVAVRDLSPAMVVEGRTAIAALVLLPFAIRQGQLRPLAHFWRPLLAYTVAELAIPWYILSDAERRLPSSLSGLLIATVPLIALVLALLTNQGNRFDRRGLLGVVIGLIGVGALLGLDIGPGDLAPAAEVGLVAVGYATGPLLAARYLGGLSSLALSAVSLLLVAVAYLPIAAWDHPTRVPPGGHRLRGRPRAGVHGPGLRGLLRVDQRDRARPGPRSSRTSIRPWPSPWGWCGWGNRSPQERVSASS